MRRVQVPPGNLPVITDAQTFTMTIDAVTTAPTKATTTDADLASWMRVGPNMKLFYTYRHTDNTGSAAGSGVYLFKLPGNYTIDSTYVPVSTTARKGVLGPAVVGDASGIRLGWVQPYDSSSLQIVYDSGGSDFAVSSSNVPISSSATIEYVFEATIPISGWKSTGGW